MSFGEAIKRARKRQQLSKAKLGRKADLATATITRLENSERSVTIDTIDKAAGELGLVVVVTLKPKPEAAGQAATVS
jgi:transcriptional regulator with XRE-family HTH domain